MNQLFTSAIREEKEYRAILENYRMQCHERTPHPMIITGLSDGAQEAFYAAIVKDLRTLSPDMPVLCLLPDEKELLKMEAALSDEGLRVMTYPLRDFVFYNVIPSREYEQQRIGVLCGIRKNTCDAILTVPDAALQYTVPESILDRACMEIRTDRDYSMDDLVSRLTAAGYTRTEMVDGVGEFAVRGGILDIFPSGAQNPVRIEFWGEEIDSMAQFDPMTQRRFDPCDGTFIPPAKELLLSDEMKKGLRAVINAQLKKAKTEESAETLRRELEALDSGMEVGFLDKYITVLYPDTRCLLDYFRGEGGRIAAPVLLQNTSSCRERLNAWEFHARETFESMVGAGAVSAKYAEYSRTQTDFWEFIDGTQSMLCETFTGGARKLSGIYTFRSKQTVSFAESYEMLREDLAHYTAENYRILLLSDNEFSADNLQKQLFDDGVTAHRLRAKDVSIAALEPGVPQIFVTGPDDRTPGFALTESRFCALSTVPGSDRTAYARALSRNSKKTKKKRSAAETILSYADLTVGDYVVHVNHGIGQYMGMETMRGVDGCSRDYLRLKYADNATIYLPCERLDMISKYIGAHADDGMVRLSAMGGTDWSKTKARVKAAAKNMAKELTQLYAARLRKPGYAFAPDDELQRAFESVFPYEETDSQLRAVDEIKADMMRPNPMDRLLCGDVGYGKTEVALRAAMKAVESGKQVAILVPTTILALQHYQTIESRFRGLPVKAEILSRFRTPTQQDEILRRLRRGEIDILVGTHRMISKDVQFRDLGLLIIDEEQRFGVAHKEKLKSIAENVDCLTLTATPIPRTLNMAMSGIRDMSILDEAPGDRVPIQTYVLEYDAMILTEALKKELRRGGQVFWLHNRVEDIDVCAGHVQEMVPDARIAVAHGKMDKEEIGEIWQRLLSGEVDILVSTTIIETGIDIPNANTLVIENADRMGLSQLHQIRGRIGRSSRRGYAYFTYPAQKILTEVASKRLQAIKEYTEFGSGFKIAMRDLEIRGAGNILGAEQHGHIYSVGYDLYIKLLNEAILEEKGEPAEQKTEAVIDIPVDAYLPEKYVRSGAQRIELYKKIAAIETPKDISDILDELADRFGAPPKAAENLVRIAYLRAQASRCRIPRIGAKDGCVFLYPQSFSVTAWTDCAKALAVGAAEPERKPAPKPSVPGRVTGVAMPVPGALPQPGKNTPLARAAALASAGRAAAGAPKTAKPTPAGSAVRLSVVSGKDPCIQAKVPKNDTPLDTAEQILACYEKALHAGI